MERREDLLEAQRHRRTQCADAMFGVAPAHALYTGPGPWLGLVLGLLVVGVLCAAGPVIDAVGHKPANSVPAAPQAPPIASAPPVASGQDIQGQDGKDGPH